MAIDEKARRDHKWGEQDRKKSAPEQAINDILPGTHPATDAYYKGRRDVPIDSDKGKGKKKD